MTSADSARRVGEILRAEGVELSPPSPGLGEWLGAVQARVFEAIDALVPPGFDATPLARPLLWTLVALAVVSLGAFLVWLFRRPHRALPVESSVPETPVSSRPQNRDWLGILKASLDRGDLPAALEATWWVLLSSLAETASGTARSREARVTGRAALRAAGRTELLPLVRELEALTYGRRPLLRDTLEPLAERVCRAVS